MADNLNFDKLRSERDIKVLIERVLSAEDITEIPSLLRKIRELVGDQELLDSIGFAGPDGFKHDYDPYENREEMLETLTAEQMMLILTYINSFADEANIESLKKLAIDEVSKIQRLVAKNRRDVMIGKYLISPVTFLMAYLITYYHRFKKKK
jgi:hypothetical protein